MAIFSLFKYNQSNRIDVRIGDGTVKITTILTVTAGPAPGERDWGGGGRNKFWEAREVYLCKFDGGTGAREVKKKGLRLKISTNSGCHQWRC